MDWSIKIKRIRKLIESFTKNSSQKSLFLNTAFLSIRREHLVKGLEDSNVEDIFNSMKEMSITLGADSTRAEKEMLDVLNFEIQIANFTLPR